MGLRPQLQRNAGEVRGREQERRLAGDGGDDNEGGEAWPQGLEQRAQDPGTENGDAGGAAAPEEIGRAHV